MRYRQKPIRYHNDYLVDTLGEVYSCKRRNVIKLKPSKTRRKNGSIYRAVLLAEKDAYIWYMCSYLVLDAFTEPFPEGKAAVHINGDTADDRLENLRWGLRGNAKLNEGLVRDIKKRLRQGCLVDNIIQDLGLSVNPRTIDHIRSGRTWQYVEV